jgi:hypothetical protein
VTSSSLGVDTSYDPDLSCIGIQRLEAYSIFLEHFVVVPILLLDPSVENSKSTSSLYQVLLLL